VADDFERILIFELNWLGDILFSFPLLRAIRGRFPKAYIACAVVPRYRELLANNPWVDSVHALSDNNSISTLKEKLGFAGMMKKEGFDACFLLKPSRTRAVMASIAGIRERIGFSGKNCPLTRVVDLPKDHVHRADQLLALAGAVGVESADGTYEYFLSNEDKEKGRALLGSLSGRAGTRVALNPGGNWGAKRWPKENFIELGRKLLAVFGEIEIVVTGASGDVSLAREIVSSIGSPRCYSAAGLTGLNQLAYIFSVCSLVVSADSGPMHLASANGAPTIALFGPTSPEMTGPRGNGRNVVLRGSVDCRIPCYEENCAKGYECMRSITAGEVFRAAEKILSE